MGLRNRGFVPALLAGAMVGGGALAMAADGATEDLRAQVQALQAKVNALEAKQLSAADVDATVKRMLADADNRSRVTPAGMTAGYTSRGFIIQDEKGDFLLHPYLQFQLRDATDWRVDEKDTGNDQADNGFEVRRMKFGFEGNAYKDFSYQFQWATNRGDTGTTTVKNDDGTKSKGTTGGTGGTPILEDAWVKYQINHDWAVLGGQFKDPLFRESLVSSMKQLAAERSLLNGILEGGDNYVQGVSALYTLDRFHGQAAFTDGFAGSNANFVDPHGDPSDAGYIPNGNKAYDFGVAARGEYMVLGDPATTWKQYSQFTALGAKEDLLIVGAAADWSQAGDANTLWYTADVQYDPVAVQGLALYGAFVGRNNTIDHTEVPGATDSFNDWGFLAQAGYLVTSRLEPFVRYDYTRANSDLLSSADADKFGTRNIHEITGGVNYYLWGQNAKLTLDLTYLPNGTPIASSGADIQKQSSDNAQWLARLQFQLVL